MSSINSIQNDEKLPPNRSIGSNHPFSFQSIRVSPLPFALIGIVLGIVSALAINFTSTSSSILVFGGVVGLILIIMIVQKPEIGTYILIFTVFTNLSDIFTENGFPSINKPLVGIVMFSIFANYILRTGKINSSARITRAEIALLAYYFTVLISLLVAVNQSKSLLAIVDLTKDIAVGICIYLTLDTKEKLKTGVRILLATVTFVAALGVIHTLSDGALTFWGLARESAFGQIGGSGGLRYGGPIAESNVWGQILVSMFPIALYQIAKTRDLLAKMIPASAALFILLAMLFTESRGAVLALILASLLIAIDLRIKATTLFGIASIGFLLLLILPSQYTERIMTLDIIFKGNQEYGYSQDGAVEGRREKMLTGLAMFRENPFLGVGFANYSDNYWSYAGNLGLEAAARNINAENTARQPHSLYIEIMAETGIFGIGSFLAFMGFILSGLYQARKRYHSKKNKSTQNWPIWVASIMMSILTFLIAGLFLHGIGFRFIWILSGLALVIIHLSTNPSSVSKIN
jgi:O-antigen ligase